MKRDNEKKKKKGLPGDPVVETALSSAGSVGSIPGQELRSRMPQSIKQKQY